MIKLTVEEQVVLLTMHEYSPLWEFIEALRDSTPRKDPIQLRSRAAEILRDFAKRGWLQLHRQSVRHEDLHGEATQVDMSQLEGILGDEKNWLVQIDRDEPTFDYYIFDTTPVAEDLIKEGAVDDVWPGGVDRS
jgi:hypothetical protein